MNMGKLIANQRRKKGISQIQLGKLLGYTTGQGISNVERGKSPLPPEAVNTIVLHLGIPRRTLFDGILSWKKTILEKRIGRYGKM